MTTEDVFRMELLAREKQLKDQIKPLEEQLRAVRVMLAASASGTSAPVLPAPAPHAVEPQVVAAPVIATGPPLPAPPAVPAVPAAPPVPDDAITARSRKRGWLMARMEQLIAEGGPTFSFNTIFEGYRAKWGWVRYPTKDAFSAMLTKVVRKRGHRVVSPGGGRRATVYQRVSAA